MKLVLTLVLLVLIYGCAVTPGSGGGKSNGKAGGDTAVVCHKGKKTLELPRSAAQAHLDHGDKAGPC
jgi:hypothetical protein